MSTSTFAPAANALFSAALISAELKTGEFNQPSVSDDFVFVPWCSLLSELFFLFLVEDFFSDVSLADAEDSFEDFFFDLFEDRL